MIIRTKEDIGGSRALWRVGILLLLARTTAGLFDAFGLWVDLGHDATTQNRELAGTSTINVPSSFPRAVVTSSQPTTRQLSLFKTLNRIHSVWMRKSTQTSCQTS